MTSNMSLRYGNASTATTTTIGPNGEVLMQPMNQQQAQYIKQNEIILNNQQINHPNLVPASMYKRNVAAAQGPVYQKVCKSPFVTHLVESKHVTKVAPQSTSIPMQPLTTTYSPYSLNSYNYQQQHLIPSYPLAATAYYDESRQDVSYSFHDMSQVLLNEAQISPAPDRLNYSTSSFNYSAIPPHLYQHYPIQYVQQQQQPYIFQNSSLSNMSSRLSNTVISDTENINTSSSLFQSSIVNKDALNSDSFLSHDSEMREINNESGVRQHDLQTSLNQQYEQHRRLPPPPYPGKFNDNKVPPDTTNIQSVSLVEATTSSETNKNIKNQAMFMRTCSPQAFKFFMEQHIENVFKHRKAREYRRMQLENEMLKAALPDELQDQMRKLLCQKETNYIRLKRAKMNKLMFETIKLLGNGAFGEVNLVRKIDTGRLYAMKTLHKTDVFNRNQAAHVKAERDILAEADNEWVVKLYYSFQDEQNLYFVMDYIPGGDLMNLLIKFQIFDEKLARFYIAELVCAIDSVHNLGFIHRDIKPDNILIDKCGHIKLTDFGLCTGFHWTHSSKYYNIDEAYNYILERKINDTRYKINNNDSTIDKRIQQKLLAHSLVGTPNYIAPELLSRKGYTKSCDWWSVGVILFEMLVGEPPFRDETSAGTQQKVINWKSTLHIPETSQCSDMAKDLIFKLCMDEEKRLGNNGANEIKAHPFFNGIDFSENLRKTKALYVPEIKYPTDTSNFEPIENKVVETNKTTFSDRQVNSNNNNNNNNNRFDASQNPNNHQQSDNSANTSKNQILYEFTFRRFFDEAYSEHFNVQSDGEENDKNMYFQRRQLSKKNTDISKESFKRKSINENESAMEMKENIFYNNNNRPESKDDNQPAIYV